MNKLRVGVLMGGKSQEREVSFNSGRTVCDHLDPARFDIIPLFQQKNGTLFILPWHFIHRGKISDFEHRLATQAQTIEWDELKDLVDFVYIALHGQFAEDGTLQGMLEVLGIPYLGSGILASALSMDKIRQKVFLRRAGIKVAADIILTPDDIQQIDTHTVTDLIERMHEAGFSLPCIIKPYKEGSSLGVRVVSDESTLIESIKYAATISGYGIQSVLIEEKINGMEFSCIAITDYKTGEIIPLPPTEIELESGRLFYDYEQKYMPGRAYKFTPARCSAALIAKIQQTIVSTMKALNITNIARIDGFVDRHENIIIIDPNTLSGMGPASFLFREAAEINMSHSDIINHLIDTELHARGMEHQLAQSQKSRDVMQTKKLRVAVLLGGASNEREISLESGRNVVYKLSSSTYEVIPVFVTHAMNLYLLNHSQLVRNSTHEIETILEEKQKISWNNLSTYADFIFIALHGGLGENGGVQGTLEMLELPYNGSGVLTSALCMDKFKTNEYLKEGGFEIPSHLLISKEEWIRDKAGCLEKIKTVSSFPLVIKPHDDGCSVMVSKVRSSQQLQESLDHVFTQKNYALIEECIIGMELTGGVLGNTNPRALPPSQTVVASDVLSMEEKFLPGAGENQTPAPLPSATLHWIQETIAAAYKALDCKGYARIDFFYQAAGQSPTGKERVVFIEVNTLPALTPATCIFHQAAEIGIRPMEFLDQIIKLGINEHSNHSSASATSILAPHTPTDRDSTSTIEF